MAAHPAVAQAAARWATRLQPLDSGLPPLPADDALWQRIEHRVFGGTQPAAAPTPWWRHWLGVRPTSALAFGLVAGLALPLLAPLLRDGAADPTQLPESYVGVLATADGKPGLIVSSLRRGHTLDLKLLKPVPLPAGRQWVLWTLDAQGRPEPVAALPDLRGSFVSVALPREAEALFLRAVELAISAEPVGPTPVAGAAPSQPYAWRGLCGKLWRLRPAPPAASASATR